MGELNSGFERKKVVRVDERESAATDGEIASDERAVCMGES